MPIKHLHDYAICVIRAHDRATHLSVAPSDDVQCPRNEQDPRNVSLKFVLHFQLLLLLYIVKQIYSLPCNLTIQDVPRINDAGP